MGKRNNVNRDAVMARDTLPENHNSIDLFKFLFSFVVVAIHTHPLPDQLYNTILGKIYDVVLQMAVPFFFIASGFFLGKKLTVQKSAVDVAHDRLALKKNLSNTIKLYLIWMAIYTPLAIIHYIEIDSSLLRSLFLYLRGVFLVGEQHNNWILWYLLSTIYAVLTMLALTKIKWDRKALILLSVSASCVFALCQYWGYYPGQVNGVFSLIIKAIKYVFSYGRIFNGMIYIPIGILLSNDIRIFPRPLLWGMFLCGFVGNFLNENKSLDVAFLVLSSIGLFGIICKLRIYGNTEVFRALRSMSKTVYFMHLYVWTGYYTVMYGKKSYGIDCFLAVSGITAAIAYIVYVLKYALQNRDKEPTDAASPRNNTK